MHLPSKGAGMDIHMYLHEWRQVEPNRCTFVGEDKWVFHYEGLPIPAGETGADLACDVITVHGVAVIEDLLKACIEDRDGWTYALNFDREEELFHAQVIMENGVSFSGLESLNPGIAMLTAYLNALKTHPPI